MTQSKKLQFITWLATFQCKLVVIFFSPSSRKASSNYAIDSTGKVTMYVEEKNRSWCSSSSENDHQAITIEVANSSGEPNWKVSDTALEKLIELCIDIC